MDFKKAFNAINVLLVVRFLSQQIGFSLKIFGNNTLKVNKPIVNLLQNTAVP